MHSRRTNLVLAAVHALAAGVETTEASSGTREGTTSSSSPPSSLPGSGFTQSDIGAYLRAHAEPMSAWEVRGELSLLEHAGEVRIDPTTAIWFLVQPPNAGVHAASN